MTAETETMRRFRMMVAHKAKQQICPQCNARMVIVDRFKENGVLFTWYECSRTDCDGQWLQKKVLVCD